MTYIERCNTEKGLVDTLMRLVQDAFDGLLQSMIDRCASEQEKAPSKASQTAIRHRLLNAISRAMEDNVAFATILQGELEKSFETIRQRMEKTAGRELDEQRRALEAALMARDEWEQSDDATRRMLACSRDIDRMLPLGDYQDRHSYQQSLRSRGLVLAALAGMTHVGAPPSKEEGT